MSEINRVYFDGKELSYTINGVEVINGEFPKEYAIEGDYLIGAGDLSLLTAVLNDKKVLKEYFGQDGNFCYSIAYKIIEESQAIAEAENIAKDINASLKSLREKYIKISDEYKKLSEYYDLPWYKRIFTKRP